MIRPLIVSALGCALLAATAQAQITATVETGHDDNPFRLSDQFDQRSGAFLDGELRLEHGFETGLFVDARIQRLASQSEDADRGSHALTLGFESEARLFGRPTEFEFHVRATGTDRTFVSRNTGEVGRFAGVAIPDRFDQDSLEVRARADIALSDAWTLRLQGDGRSRAYQSYANLGLSNLDYDQVFAHARLRYWPDRTVDAQIGGSIGQRVYDDRRGRALDTGIVAGSELEFGYVSFDASWKYVFRPHHDVRVAYTHDAREDNVTGYYDTSLNRTRLRYRYMPEWGHRFSAEIEYRDFDFDNIPAALIIADEENVAPNDGVRLTLTYHRRLVRTDAREVWLEASLVHDDFSSPNTAFNHDRTVARVGFVFEFDAFSAD